MRRSSRVILLLGIFLAVGAFVLIVFLGGGGGGPQPTATPAIANLVLAAVDIPQGTTITQSMLTTTQVPLADAPGDAFTLPERVIGQTARQSIAAGAYVPLSAITGAQGIVNIGAELGPGERAVALQFDDPNKVVGFLVQSGDRVDVIVALTNLPIGFTFDLDPGKKIVPDVPLPNGAPPPQGGAGGTGFQLIPSSAINATSAKLLIQNVRVVYARAQPVAQPTEGPSPSPGAQAVGGPETIVLALTAQQAEVMSYVQVQVASANATSIIYLAIRSPQDAQASADITTGIVLRSLIEDWGVLPPRLLIVPDQGR